MPASGDSGLSLQERLSAVLGEVLSLEIEPDGAMTVSHDGTFASLRVVSIADGLELVSLTQIIAWDLPLTAKLRDRVSGLARESLLGTVSMVEKAVESSGNGVSAAASTKKSSAKKVVDVMLRYNFPGAGLGDEALRTLVLMVLATGADVRRTMVP